MIGGHCSGIQYGKGSPPNSVHWPGLVSGASSHSSQISTKALTVFHHGGRVPLEVGAGLALEQLVSERQELPKKTAKERNSNSQPKGLDHRDTIIPANLSASTLRFSAAIFICVKSSGRNLEVRVGLAVRDKSAAGGRRVEGGVFR